MKRYFQSSVSALAMSALVMGSVVVATVSITAAPAFSQSSNANSNASNGNRNENSNRGGRGNNGRGSTASSLGALNAAHANANALANAAENSRVGMIAIYKLAVEATAEAGDAFDAAEAALNTFIAQCDPDGAEPSLSVEDCQSLLDAATESAGVVEAFTYETYVEWLEQAVSDADAAQIKAKELEDTALEAAANKVTNEEVIAALWDLLELSSE